MKVKLAAHPWILTAFLICGTVLSGQVVVRGPYLQKSTPNNIVVRWRTDVPTDSRVLWVAAPGTPSQFVTHPTLKTEHELTISGLSPETEYIYWVGTTSAILAQHAEQRFRTPPPEGARRRVRVWALGDSGTGNAHARSVRDAYRKWVGTRGTDVWLMLGDNAYSTGTDAQYQSAVFDTYTTELRGLPVWPTLGNHDAASTTTFPSTSGPYYDIFSLPIAGEAGGLPSGTESYYSFNHGNVHFVCLNSAQVDLTHLTAMTTWLTADLQANTQDWTVAFWHHPPYTKGSHNSDTELQLIGVRSILLPILESHGVDLVLCGHSHSVERSMLIDGHYGDSSTLNPATMIKDSGDGRWDGTGSYRKGGAPGTPHDGAMYVVAGSSGLATQGAFDHPVMITNLQRLASLVLEFWGLQVDILVLDSDGSVCDRFTMTKGSSTPVTMDYRTLLGAPPSSIAVAEDTLIRVHDQGIALGAAWTTPAVNSAFWRLIPTPAGFGESAVTGFVQFGTTTNVHPTTYFRRNITLGQDPADILGLRMWVDYDDAFIAYLNGTEIARSANLPAGAITFATLATAGHESGTKELFDLDAHAGLLTPGNNTLAIEVHQDSATSDDLFLSVRLQTLSADQNWDHHDAGVDLGTAWRNTGFNSSTWNQGYGPFGAEHPEILTDISTTTGGLPVTTYYRKSFDLASPAQSLEQLLLDVTYDDALVVWLNGVEVARRNLPSGPIGFFTPASTAQGIQIETIDISSAGASLLPTGNVLAIELHRAAGTIAAFLDARLRSATAPQPYLAGCAEGTIFDAASEPESTLFVDGSDGGLGRSVTHAVGAPFEIQLEAPTMSTGPHEFALAFWPGTPTAAQQVASTSLMGSICFDPFGPQMIIVASNLPGLPGIVPAGALPLSIPLPLGLPAPQDFTLQGVLSVSPGTFRLTNAIRVHIAP